MLSCLCFFISEVKFANYLSELSAKVNVSVILPVPTDLSLTLWTADDLLPSCVPSDLILSSDNGQKTINVFTNEKVSLEAAVSVGVNLSFHWMFSDDQTSRWVRPYLEACKKRNCTTSLMVSFKIRKYITQRHVGRKCIQALCSVLTLSLISCNKLTKKRRKINKLKKN